MTSSLLEQELEPLQAQIGQVQKTVEALKGELSVAEAEVRTFYVDQQRFDALRDVCNAIDRLGELDAADFFWEGLSGSDAGHLGRLRERIARFEGEIQGVMEREKSLRGQTLACFDQLDYLDEEIRQAHAREERRVDELVIEREISPLPYRQMIMPWSNDGESESRYRRAMLISLILSISFGALLPFVKLPELDRSAPIEIPKRLAMLVKMEQEKPKPVKKPKEEKKEGKAEEKEEGKGKKEEGKQREEQEKPKEEGTKAAPAERVAAGNKAHSSGVMKFKSSFKDLMDETPVARLGVDARLSNNAASAAGEAQASRSLVAMQAGSGSGSGGIGNAAISRNLGSGNGGGNGSGRAGTGSGNGIGRAGNGNGSGIGRSGTGFARVESAIAGLAAKEAKPLSSRARPGRTDEEIQILFDRYKAALYRIYNTELRKNPTLGGKMVLRITIEPSGAVSACAVDSSNMGAPEFSAQIVDRVKKFNFGAKDGVPKTTILYPIDFLPAR